jgi:two-component system, chemotaxis family, protein-glutamate methylesterase/glutaminase
VVPKDLTPLGQQFDAVVIGASAGAVDALGHLLPSVPHDTRIPVSVVVHLSPGKPSVLPDIFRAKCSAPVNSPLDKQPLDPGIWIAAPDYHLLVEADQCFSVSLDDPVNYSRPSIDVLFESAAEVFGPAVAAFVLTGANRDGATGARRIRDAGGLVVVQDPAEAEIDIMPRAAIEDASPQLVAPLADLALLLSDICRGPR